MSVLPPPAGPAIDDRDAEELALPHATLDDLQVLYDQEAAGRRPGPLDERSIVVRLAREWLVQAEDPLDTSGMDNFERACFYARSLGAARHHVEELLGVLEREGRNR